MESFLKHIRKWEISLGRFGIVKVAALIPLFILALVSTAGAKPPSATIQYQPMTSDGLAAEYPFESWVVFDMSSDPNVPGLSLPAGATFLFSFLPEFKPQDRYAPQAVLLYNWPQSPAPVPFTVALDPAGPAHNRPQAERSFSFYTSPTARIEIDPPALGTAEST